MALKSDHWLDQTDSEDIPKAYHTNHDDRFIYIYF